MDRGVNGSNEIIYIKWTKSLMIYGPECHCVVTDRTFKCDSVERCTGGFWEVMSWSAFDFWRRSKSRERCHSGVSESSLLIVHTYVLTHFWSTSYLKDVSQHFLLGPCGKKTARMWGKRTACLSFNSFLQYDTEPQQCCCICLTL